MEHMVDYHLCEMIMSFPGFLVHSCVKLVTLSKIIQYRPSKVHVCPTALLVRSGSVSLRWEYAPLIKTEESSVLSF